MTRIIETRPERILCSFTPLIVGLAFGLVMSQIHSASAGDPVATNSIQFVSNDVGGVAPTNAEPSPDAVDGNFSSALAFVDILTREGMSALTDNSLSSSQRQATLRQVFQESFAAEDIARLILGRYWRSATDQEKLMFGDSLAVLVADTLVHNLPVGEFKIFSAQQIDGVLNGTETVEVKTVFVAENVSTIVYWTLNHTANEYKVFDITIGGHSFLMAQRNSFEHSIQRNGGSVEAAVAELGTIIVSSSD